MSVLMRRTKIVELVMHLNENTRRKRTLWIDRYVDGERLMDPRRTREVVEDGFNLALLEAVDEGLLLLGEDARDLIYHIVENMYDIRRDQISEKPEALHEALEDSLGPQARVVEKLIAREFLSRIGLSFKGFENLTLLECIRYARKHSNNTDRLTLSQLLTQIRYLRVTINSPEQEILQNSKRVRAPQQQRRADPQRALMDHPVRPHHVQKSPSQPEPFEKRQVKTGRARPLFCPICGKLMDADPISSNAVCASCGAVVQLPSKQTSAPTLSRPSSTTGQPSICIRCGAQIRGNKKICPNCESARPFEIPSIY